MINLKELAGAMLQIAEERGLNPQSVLEIVETALAAAYKKEYREKGEIVKAKLDPKTGDLKFWQVKIVVTPDMLKTEEEMAEEKEVHEKPRKKEKESDKKQEKTTEEISLEEKKIFFNPERHILLEEAKKIKKDVKPEDELTFPMETKDDFGRIAAQTAKQVILQKLHEVEKDYIYEEFKQKENSIVNGIIQRFEGRNVYVDLGKTLGIMFPNEAIPGEPYRIGQRLKFYVYGVQKDPRGIMIFLSRSHPLFAVKLISMEIPEISEGKIEIKEISREAGSRTKVAVQSNDPAIDPIGACVGQKGTRINIISSELGGERVDVVEYSDEPEKFITKSISPAKVKDVQVLPRKHAIVLVDPDQLSLAIGKGGQNVRLAAKLTGWKIDIRSSSAPEVAIEGGTAEAQEEEMALVESKQEETGKLKPIQEETKPEKEKPASKTKKAAVKKTSAQGGPHPKDDAPREQASGQKNKQKRN